MTVEAPSSRKVAWGSASQGGVCIPAPASSDLAVGLSKASRQAWAERAGVGDAHQVEHAAQRAVLAGAAVQGDEDRVRRLGDQPRQQLGIGVEQHRLDPDPAQGVGHPPAAAQRDVALHREPAGQDEGSLELGHASSGVGPSSAGAARAPARTDRAEGLEQLQLLRRARPASRRTPSRMRSGGGKQ